MSAPPRFDRGHTDDLMAFLAAARRRTTRWRTPPSGWRRPDSGRSRRPTPGTATHAAGKYVLRGGAIIAWYVPEGAAPHTPFRIVGAHTDSPNLRVKPLPDTGAHGWRQVAVEIYGGPLLNTWLDRDLGLAGRLVLRDGSHPPGQRRPAAAARAAARRPPGPRASTPTGSSSTSSATCSRSGASATSDEGDLIALRRRGGRASTPATSPAGT